MRLSFDHDKQFETFVSADEAVPGEVLLRRTLLGISCLIFALSMGEPAFFLWGLGYVLGDVAYVALLRPATRPVTRKRFWLTAIVSNLLGLYVAVIAIHLSWTDAGQYHPLAACLVVGLALHCMCSHSTFGTAFWIDLSTVAIATIGVTAGAVRHAGGDSLGPAFVLAAVAVLVYFVHSVGKVVRERRALRRRVAVEVQDQKMRALGQFTSGVAHDFNNILTVIGGNIELARLNSLPAQSDALLAEAEAATSNAAALVKQLLAYSRKSTLIADELEVGEVLDNLSRVAARLLPATVRLETAMPRTPTHLHADRAMLETALLNLVINARDAMDDTPGRIRLSASQPNRAPGAPAMVTLTVEDDGPGMAPETLSRAIDPFFTTKAMGQGSGLGLSLVNGFAEQSGGRLVLQNRAGGGFRAELTLPQTQVAPPRSVASATKAATPRTADRAVKPAIQET